ncbi:MAG: helix-turn-helix transcriptional regulator [Patescibacteria group bacterium]
MDKFQPVPYQKVLAKALKDPEFKAEYDRLGPEFDIIESIIRKRLEKGMSQTQLAQKMGTRQSALSRLESGNYNPSLLFLKRVAAALDSRVSISLI